MCLENSAAITKTRHYQLVSHVDVFFSVWTTLLSSAEKKTSQKPVKAHYMYRIVRGSTVTCSKDRPATPSYSVCTIKSKRQITQSHQVTCIVFTVLQFYRIRSPLIPKQRPKYWTYNARSFYLYHHYSILDSRQGNVGSICNANYEILEKSFTHQLVFFFELDVCGLDEDNSLQMHALVAARATYDERQAQIQR